MGATPATLFAISGVQFGLGPLTLGLGVLTLLVNLSIINSDIRYGLALFILGAGMSPKLPGLYDNLRVEDLVFVLVFFKWASSNRAGVGLGQVTTPIFLPFVVLTVMSIMSTIFGITIGVIPDLKYSFFLQAKRVEYYFIFVIVATSVRDPFWLRILAITFVISGALAAGYGILNQESAYDQATAETRVSGPAGENYNTLSGYLVICVGAGLAIMAEIKGRIPKLTMMWATSIAAAALLLSFSREGYIMLAGSLLVFGFSRHRIILVLAVAGLVVAGLLYSPVAENFSRTFDTVKDSQNADPGANSLTARYRAWEYRLNGWFIKQPVFGNGVGAVALSVDNEYVLRLCEVGVVGFSVFIWFIGAIGTTLTRLQRLPGLTGGLALGLKAGFMGMVIQGMAATAFTTIRTMEPFWFLLGLLYASLAIDRSLRKAREPAPEPFVPVRALPALHGANA